jgi:hypothetical protein
MKFKPALGIIAIALAMTSIAFSQTGNAPKLIIKQTEHNFGEVKKGETAQHAFTFKNEGKADLEIKNVAPS